MCGADLDGLRADAQYCGRGCRKEAEYERARLQQHLLRLERWRENVLLFRLPKAQLAHTDEQLAQAKQRLRELLGS